MCVDKERHTRGFVAPVHENVRENVSENIVLPLLGGATTCSCEEVTCVPNTPCVPVRGRLPLDTGEGQF